VTIVADPILCGGRPTRRPRYLRAMHTTASGRKRSVCRLRQPKRGSGTLLVVTLQKFNMRQRLVIVVGLGAGLFFFGEWAMTWGSRGSFGWVAYAPLSGATSGGSFLLLHPWAQFLIWLTLVVIWVVCSVALLHRRPNDDDPNPKDEQLHLRHLDTSLGLGRGQRG